MEGANTPESTENHEAPRGVWQYLQQRWKWLIAAALLGFGGDSPVPHGETGEERPAPIHVPSNIPEALQKRIELELGMLDLQEIQWSRNALQARWYGMRLTVELSQEGSAQALHAGAVTLTSARPLAPRELARVTQDLLLCAGRMRRSPAESPRLSDDAALQRVADGSLHVWDIEGKRWIITPDAMLPVEGEDRIDEAYREWQEAERKGEVFWQKRKAFMERHPTLAMGGILSQKDEEEYRAMDELWQKSEEKKRAAESKMEVRLRSSDGQEIIQKYSPYDRDQFTRVARRGDTETQENFRNGRMTSGWRRNMKEGWLEEVRCNDQGQVEDIDRYQTLPSGGRRYLYTEYQEFRPDGTLHYTQRGEDFTSYARTGEQVARWRARADADVSKVTLVKRDGTTIGTFNDEKAQRPRLTEEEYFRELAATLTTPEHLQQYFRFFEYTWDEFHLRELLIPSASYQHPHTTARREVEEKLRGDCEDYALFFEEILRLQGHNAWTISVNMDQSPLNNHSVCVWLRPHAEGKGFDIVSIDTGGVYINGKCIDHPQYEPYSDGVETPEEALRIIEKQFDCTLDPRAITVVEWNGLEYELRRIDASQLLPGASQGTRMHPVTVALYILRLVEFAGAAWMAGATASHIRKRMQRQRKEKSEEHQRRRESNRKRKKEEKGEKRERKRRKRQRKNQRKRA